MGSDHVIGIENQLPWHLPEDLKHFRRLTLGHPVIMGRKTHESIRRALPGRLNIIVTRNTNYKAAGCEVAHSLEEAILLATQHDDKEIFVIGGAQIYVEALNFADRLYLTEIEAVDDNRPLFGPFQGSAYFPKLNETIWRMERKGRKLRASGTKEKGFYYRFRKYVRRGKTTNRSVSSTLSEPDQSPRLSSKDIKILKQL